MGDDAHIPKMSLYIITLNEEKRLPTTLESVRGLVDEIVVVDDGSTDGTGEIARAHGARFLYHEWESVGHQVKWAEEQCAHRWVLRLDADEEVSPELAREISQVRRSGAHDGYRLLRADMIPGRKKPNPLVKHFSQIRLYNRDSYAMSGKLDHDDVVRLKPGATVKTLRGLLHHHWYVSIHQMVERHNSDTDALASRAAFQGKNYSPWRMVGICSLNFLKRFFLHRYFLYGFWGFVCSVEYAFCRFLKFAKFYELEQSERRGVGKIA
jgi:glycosyltransferase involved in cell wall biosynthesis